MTLGGTLGAEALCALSAESQRALLRALNNKHGPYRFEKKAAAEANAEWERVRARLSSVPPVTGQDTRKRDATKLRWERWLAPRYARRCCRQKRPLEARPPLSQRKVNFRAWLDASTGEWPENVVAKVWKRGSCLGYQNLLHG